MKSDLAADDFCLKVPPSGIATEAAFPSILVLFNLRGEFQRATGMTDYRHPATRRVSRRAGCGAILGRVGHGTVLVASAAWGGLEERNLLFHRILLYEIPIFLYASTISGR